MRRVPPKPFDLQGRPRVYPEAAEPPSTRLPCRSLRVRLHWLVSCPPKPRQPNPRSREAAPTCPPPDQQVPPEFQADYREVLEGLDLPTASMHHKSDWQLQWRPFSGIA